jgi:hypothetical protein
MSLSKRLRFEIFRRDNYGCVYCGKRPPAVTLEVDHKIPRCNGGTDDPENLVTACWNCNRGKGPLDEFGNIPVDHGLCEDGSPDWQRDHYDSLDVVWGTWIDHQLPKWMLPPRNRYHVNLNFDIWQAIAELPEADQVLTLTDSAISRMTESFDWGESFDWIYG